MVSIAFSSVLITLFYIFPGFVVRKMGKVTEKHLTSISGILIYICSPCMLLSSFMMMDFNWDDFGKMGLFFVVTLILQVLFLLLVYSVTHKKYENNAYRVLTVGSMMGNVGFCGQPIIKALLPGNPEVACYSMIYVTSMNVLVFTVGEFCLTRDKRFVSLKAACCNPTTFGMAMALPAYVFGLRHFMPELLVNSIRTIGSMPTPLCMFILGIQLASASLKEVFNKPMVYLTAFLKLLVFPVFCYTIVRFLPFDEAFKLSILVLSGTPCAAVILSLAEMHKASPDLAADSIMVSTLLSFLTIPLLTLLV